MIKARRHQHPGFNMAGSSPTFTDFDRVYKEMIRDVGDALPDLVASILPVGESPAEPGSDNWPGRVMPYSVKLKVNE